MPLTKKGRKVKKAMAKSYGKKKGAQVFYAMENIGKMKGMKKKKHMMSSMKKKSVKRKKK